MDILREKGSGRMRKRVLWFLVAVLVVAAVFLGTGCGGSNGSENIDNTQSNKTSTANTITRANTVTKNEVATAPEEPTQVKIGSQTWMAKNLDVGTFANGDAIPEAKTAAEWMAAGDAQKPAWGYYDNDPANGKTYGRLYNWYAVSDPRGLCPQGWHVPTDAEWTTLESYLGGAAGGKLKETGTFHWQSPNTGATNSSGFSALPGGFWHGNGVFYSLGSDASFWSATSGSSGIAWNRSLDYISSDIDGYDAIWDNKEYGFSVRCVAD